MAHVRVPSLLYRRDSHQAHYISPAGMLSSVYASSDLCYCPAADHGPWNSISVHRVRSAIYSRKCSTQTPENWFLLKKGQKHDGNFFSHTESSSVDSESSILKTAFYYLSTMGLLDLRAALTSVVNCTFNNCISLWERKDSWVSSQHSGTVLSK